MTFRIDSPAGTQTVATFREAMKIASVFSGATVTRIDSKGGETVVYRAVRA